MQADKREKGSLANKASAWVREQILSKNLTPGTVIRPEEVGKQLGISQTPAREALQGLRIEGFLIGEPGVGFVVAPLDQKDIADIFTAHALLAGEVGARAASKATDLELDELEAIHFELLAATRRGNWKLVEERNHAFHRHITFLANSPKLAHILGIVSRYVPRTFYSEVEGWANASANDHSDIIDAFRNRDIEGARMAMQEHMHHAGELLARSFQTSNLDDKVT